MDILIGILTVVEVLICLLLILVVLMQRPRQEGLGASFGNDAMTQIAGAQTTNVLQKFTVYLAVALFVLTLSLALLVTRQQSIASGGRIFDAPAPAAAPAVEAAPAPADAPTAEEAQKSADSQAKKEEASKPAVEPGVPTKPLMDAAKEKAAAEPAKKPEAAAAPKAATEPVKPAPAAPVAERFQHRRIAITGRDGIGNLQPDPAFFDHPGTADPAA